MPNQSHARRGHGRRVGEMRSAPFALGSADQRQRAGVSSGDGRTQIRAERRTGHGLAQRHPPPVTEWGRDHDGRKCHQRRVVAQGTQRAGARAPCGGVMRAAAGGDCGQAEPRAAVIGSTGVCQFAPWCGTGCEHSGCVPVTGCAARVRRGMRMVLCEGCAVQRHMNRRRRGSWVRPSWPSTGARDGHRLCHIWAVAGPRGHSADCPQSPRQQGQQDPEQNTAHGLILVAVLRSCPQEDIGKRDERLPTASSE